MGAAAMPALPWSSLRLPFQRGARTQRTGFEQIRSQTGPSRRLWRAPHRKAVRKESLKATRAGTAIN